MPLQPFMPPFHTAVDGGLRAACKGRPHEPIVDTPKRVAYIKPQDVERIAPSLHS